MRKTVLVLATVFAFSLAPVLWAQGRGGTQGRGQSGQRGQRPSATGQQRGGQQGQMGQRGKGTMDQKRQRIHANDQQRQQYRTCTQTANRVSTQARQMAQTAKGGGVNNPAFRRQHEQLRNGIRTMQEEHNRFMQGLSGEQRAAMQERIRKMEQQQERLQSRLQALDQELAKSEPDRKRIENQAREMEKAMKEWQKQYREMGSEMNIPTQDE